MIRDYPDEFRGLPTESPEFLIRALAAARGHEHEVAQGLVLGYPLTSCKTYVVVRHLTDTIEATSEMLKKVDNGVGKRELDAAWFGNRFVGRAGRGGHAQKVSIEERRALLQKYLSGRSTNPAVTAGDQSWLPNAIEHYLHRRKAGAYGVTWVDYEGLKDSVAKERRLKAAFEQSGILEN